MRTLTRPYAAVAKIESLSRCSSRVRFRRAIVSAGEISRYWSPGPICLVARLCLMNIVSRAAGTPWPTASGDVEADVVLVQADDVVEVAGNVGGGAEQGVEPGRPHPRQGTGQEVPLQAGRPAAVRRRGGPGARPAGRPVGGGRPPRPVHRPAPGGPAPPSVELSDGSSRTRRSCGTDGVAGSITAGVGPIRTALDGAVRIGCARERSDRFSSTRVRAAAFTPGDTVGEPGG